MVGKVHLIQDQDNSMYVVLSPTKVGGTIKTCFLYGSTNQQEKYKEAHKTGIERAKTLSTILDDLTINCPDDNI